MLLDKIAGETGPCGKETGIDGLDPCGRDGAAGGLMQILHNVLLGAQFVYIISGGGRSVGTWCGSRRSV